MLIYIILVAIILILSMLKVNKKKYCIIIGILMTIIVGFRDYDLGMKDTAQVYIPIFEKLANMTFQESYLYIKNTNIEIVFYMLTRIYIFISSNIRLYIILLSIPINLVVSRFIYKYSKIPSLSFIMYFSLNYFAQSFTLLRHCIALAIILLAYDFLVQNKNKKFFITVLIATLFHRTAFIFVIAYWVKKIKSGFPNILLIFLAFFFSYFFGKEILSMVIKIISIQHYYRYLEATSNTLTFFAINLCIYIFVYVISPKYKQEKESNLLSNLTTLGICLASCSLFIGEALRISTFFTIFSIIILPNAISTIKDTKTKSIIIIMLNIIFIAYFFLFSMENNAIYPYTFGEFV